MPLKSPGVLLFFWSCSQWLAQDWHLGGFCMFASFFVVQELTNKVIPSLPVCLPIVANPSLRYLQRKSKFPPKGECRTETVSSRTLVID